MLWYSHLFQNVPQFIVIHTVKSFGIVNKAEIDVFLELSLVSIRARTNTNPVNKNLPADAGDTGFIPDLGRSHRPQIN